MDWTDIIGIGGAAAVAISFAVAAIAWLARSLITHTLSRELEDYKNRLAVETSRELARLTSSLEISAAREKTRFDLFQQKRADVVARVYALLARMHYAARSFANPASRAAGAAWKPLFDELSTAGDEFILHFREHRIFFPEETSEEIDHLFTKILQATLHSKDALKSPDIYGTEPLHENWRVISEEIPPVLKGLESQFRELLGSDLNHSAATHSIDSAVVSVPNHF